MRPARRCSRAPREPIRELAGHRLGEAVQQLARLCRRRIETDLDVGARPATSPPSSSSRPSALRSRNRRWRRLARARSDRRRARAGRPAGCAASALRSPGRRAAARPSARARRPSRRRARTAARGRGRRAAVRAAADGHGRGREILEAEAHGASPAACVAQHSPALTAISPSDRPASGAVPGCRRHGVTPASRDPGGGTAQKKLAAALIENARIMVLNPNERIECASTRRRIGRLETATSEVCAVTAMVKAK